MRIIDVSELADSPQYQKIKNNPPNKVIITEQGHCSVWWALKYLDKNIGLIGHFYAGDESTAHKLLKQAEAYLSQQGCSHLIGPIDGNTWQPYRLNSWSDGSPAFFMEPQNPEQWPIWWQQAGFSPWQSYNSTITEHLHILDERLPRTKERLSKNGIHWRSLRPDFFEDELKLVFQLSLQTFSNNIFYSPISETEFLQQYLPYRNLLDPDYLLIAFDNQEQCCGYIFAMPDYLQLERGEALSRLIIKTVAISPLRQCAGLGAVLVEQVQQNALEKGLSQAIHALMHDQNNSSNIGKRAQVLRRYTLYKKTLS